MKGRKMIGRSRGERNFGVKVLVKVQTQMELFSLGSHFCEKHGTWHINNWAATAVSVTLNQKHTAAKQRQEKQWVGESGRERDMERGKWRAKGGVPQQP